MSRDLDPDLAAALSYGLIIPELLVELTFKSATKYVWSGPGNIVYDAQTYIGVGSLGKMGAVTEGVEVKADGTSLTLSGIDPTLLNESLTDILPGAPATISFGLLTQNVVLIGAPYQLFAGTMDQPKVTVGEKTISITIALENCMIDLSRPSQRRYTGADQRLYYPTDCAFDWVPQLIDIALNWGS